MLNLAAKVWRQDLRVGGVPPKIFRALCVLDLLPEF